jgi:hypothetical protein
MNTKVVLALTVALAVCLGAGGVTLAAGNWADEIVNAASVYKASYPAGNWDPYFETLTKVREGVGRGDEQIVKVEMDHFLKMLVGREHGINDVAADELYNFALSVRSNEQSTSATSMELEIGNERPMSVPDHTIVTPFEGGKPCGPEGCDYWLDDVYDPGAAG